MARHQPRSHHDMQDAAAYVRQWLEVQVQDAEQAGYTTEAYRLRAELEAAPARHRRLKAPLPAQRVDQRP